MTARRPDHGAVLPPVPVLPPLGSATSVHCGNQRVVTTVLRCGHHKELTLSYPRPCGIPCCRRLLGSVDGFPQDLFDLSATGT